MSEDANPASLVLGGVILAAGMSVRMGRPKALLDLGGQPLIRRLVNSARQVRSLGPLLVVTGHEPQNIRQALANENVEYVDNPLYETGGMFSSVKTGVGAIFDRCDAFFLMLLDQPLVRSQTLQQMWQAWQTVGPAMVVPSHRHHHGHPLLFASRYGPTITSLNDGATLRDFVTTHRELRAVVDVDDPGVLTMLDTPDDYDRVKALWTVSASR